MFRKTRISAAAVVVLGGITALTAMPVVAQPAATRQAAQTIEITGSRIKRVDAEGALPITTFSRADLEASGASSVAEFVRNLTFSSAGNFRPQSGSSAQSFAGIDLRGLGEERTLVLLDGRRVVKAPNVGNASDLNSIPMAAIERVEVLTDGASAIYGSDAIGGVVNFITRKNMEGGRLSVEVTRPSLSGGDRESASALFGITGQKGRALVGVSTNSRDIVFSNERPWGEAGIAGSTFSNNFMNFPGSAGANAVPGGCAAANFRLVPNTAPGAAAGSQTCLYDFRATAADEAAIKNKSMFLFGETRINDDWSAFVQGTVSRVSSFGRYAPTPSSPFLGQSFIRVPVTSPNNPTAGTANARELQLRHRFAAAGNRDTSTENNVYDVIVGTQGVFAGADIEAGIRWTTSKYNEIGRGYIVGSIAADFIASGRYNIFDPFSNSAETLQAITATIGRDSVYKQSMAYVNGSKPIFKMDGGMAAVSVGAETRSETYSDIYDSLSEAGQVVGSAGNSSSGSRDVTSVYGELLLPVMKNLELSFAGRYEKYSDFGNNFAPKASLSWKPIDAVKVRASVAQGFRGPSLDILNAKTTFSATSVIDARTAVVVGASPTAATQISEFRVSNSALKAEKSDQFSIGAAWDVTPMISVKADYWSVSIKDAITLLGGVTLVNRDNGVSPLAIPAGLSVIRNATTGAIERVNAGYANEGTVKTDGLDLGATLNFKLGAYGSTTHSFGYSRLMSYKVNDVEVAGEYARPKDRASIGNKWTMGNFDAAWNINVIGSSIDFNANGSIAGNLPTYVTHDLQLGYATPWNGKLIVGAVNITEKLPKVDEYSGRPFEFALYDYYGRQVYVRYSQSF